MPTPLAAGCPVFVAGYGLASALGPSLAAASALMLSSGTSTLDLPLRRALVPGESAPHFSLRGQPPAKNWFSAARHLILQVMVECGALDDRSAPLFIASSSIHIGGIEQGGTDYDDCLCFSEDVARWLDWAGPVFWVSTACTSAINALRSAQRMVESGAFETAVVLGLEIDNLYSAAGFSGMQLLSQSVPQPLGITRDGLVLGEAVAAVRLTSNIGHGEPASAGPLGISFGHNKRSQTPLHCPSRWRLRGGANVVDGSDPAGASQHAVAEMARQALQAAGLQAKDIDLIKLQAAGSPHNDAIEISGLREVFGDLPVLCSLKPLLGHTLGAAGVAELALLLACREAEIWPTQCTGPVDPVLGAMLGESWPVPCRYWFVIILGFGGGHAALVLEDTLASQAAAE